MFWSAAWLCRQTIDRNFKRVLGSLTPTPHLFKKGAMKPDETPNIHLEEACAFQPRAAAPPIKNDAVHHVHAVDNETQFLMRISDDCLVTFILYVIMKHLFSKFMFHLRTSVGVYLHSRLGMGLW